MNDVKKKLTKARTQIILEQPFFGSLIMRLPLRENNEIQTMQTDGIQIEYSREFVDSLSTTHVKGVLAHEIMHVALNHTTRRGSRDGRRWNIAGDYAVNTVLIDSGFSLPEGALLNRAYQNMETETIYTKLPENADAGSGAGASCGEVVDRKGEEGQTLSEAEKQGIEANNKIRVQQAVNAAAKAGKLPESLKRYTDEITNPALPWRDVLRRFLKNRTRNDYRWFPPNRRYISQGLYLPTCRSEELGRILIAVDSSGSVNSKMLSEFANEITAICEECEISTVEVVYCDTKVHPGGEYTKSDLPIRLEAKGGGGTMFSPVFDYVEEKIDVIEALIYLTDGRSFDTIANPGFPVLWALPKGCENRQFFGEELHIGEAA